MKEKLEILKTKLFGAYLTLAMVWIFCALGTQIFFVYLQVTEQHQRQQDMANKLMWKIDGTFKDNPDNIWYEGSKK